MTAGGQGFVALDGTVTLVVRTKNGSGVVTDPTSDPTYRVYGQSGLMSSGTGTMSALDTGTVSGAADDGGGEIRITTSAAHNLQTGDRIRIYGVGGTTEANANWTITVQTSTTFDLDGSTFSNAFTSSGTYEVLGLYSADVSATSGNGYARGETYHAVVTWIISGPSTLSEELVFTVV